MSLTYLLSILSYHLILSCTFIYIRILFIYGTFVCFNLVLFKYYTFICLLPVLVFFIFQFYILLHSMYYYIYHFLDCIYISCIISCSGYTPMLYFLFFIFILVLSYIFILYAFILYFSHTVILYYSYTSYTSVCSYSIIYFMLSYTFCTFLVLV